MVICALCVCWLSLFTYQLFFSFLSFLFQPFQTSFSAVHKKFMSRARATSARGPWSVMTTRHPAHREEQHVQTHDSSGKPESEEAQHIVQGKENLEHRETVDQFDIATNDANIDFSVSGIPEETVKRSATMNILDLIRRITRHPQKQAVQNDLDKKQSFNAFSAESKKAIKESGNIEISEIVNTEPKLQCKFCLTHCNPGIIYCVCGHLMVEDSGEHRKYMLSTLNSFTIGNFYIRKDRPRGYRYGKAPGCKEFHTAHQLAKKCRKKGYDSIYDRYMRDKHFRSAMIEHSRTEKVIIEMDNLANEDHSFRVSKNEIEYYRQIGGYTQTWHMMIKPCQ